MKVTFNIWGFVDSGFMPLFFYLAIFSQYALGCSFQQELRF